MILVFVLIFSSCAIKSRKHDLISQLKRVAKLSTTEVVIEKVVYNKDDGGWFSKDAYFVASTEARVKIGIDLNKLNPETDIVIRGSSITLYLPPPEITNFSYPAEKFEVNQVITNAREVFLNRANLEEIDKYYREAEDQIRSSLPKTDVFETARKQTINVLTSLVRKFGYSVVHIEFKDNPKPSEL